MSRNIHDLIEGALFTDALTAARQATADIIAMVATNTTSADIGIPVGTSTSAAVTTAEVIEDIANEIRSLLLLWVSAATATLTSSFLPIRL